MSLDVYLRMTGEKKKHESRIFVREDGQTKELSRAEWDERFPGREPFVIGEGESDVVFADNITHNLRTMAINAALYPCLWRPEEIGIEKAEQLIKYLEAGLSLLAGNRDAFEKYNPENGWGNYENLVDFVQKYLKACREYPEATVSVSR